MKIFNIIMNRELGGAEQAFLDYHQALTSENHEVINITSSFARINEKLLSFSSSSIKLPNLFPWCIISKIYLKLLVLIYKPALIIAHGGRAINFSCSLGNHLVPVIGVTHSYGTKHILKCDYIIALDKALRDHFIEHGYPESKIFIVPNMVRVDHFSKREKNSQIYKDQACIIIGAMGRLVSEKGFNYLIEAISILKEKNYNIKLKLGGAGLMERELRNLVNNLNLEDNIEFIGWIENKNTFFQSIDIFCVPSTFETFGIVALEAMANQVPLIVTNTGGLKIIVKQNVTGLVVDTTSSKQLATAIAKLIDSPELAQNLKQNAYQKILSTYDMRLVRKDLSKVLEKITGQY